MEKPLTEKYRPKEIEEIVGNSKIIESVLTMIKNEEIVDMIYHGTFGVGKTTLAHAIGRRILINYPVGLNYFNASDINKKGEIHDKVIMDSKTKIQGNYKLIILDECESLTPKAWMSLKTWLETKSNKIKVIFIANDFGKVPDAIIDRCQVYRFKKVSDENIFERIKLIVKLENIKLSDKDLMDIAEISNGSVRRAVKQLKFGKIEKIDEDLNFEEIFNYITKKKTKEAYKKLYGLFEDFEDRIVIDELFNYVFSHNYKIEDIYLTISELERDIILGCSIYTSSMTFVINIKRCILSYFEKNKTK